MLSKCVYTHSLVSTSYSLTTTTTTSTKFFNCSKNQIKLKNVAFYSTQCDTFIFPKCTNLYLPIVFYIYLENNFFNQDLNFF